MKAKKAAALRAGVFLLFSLFLIYSACRNVESTYGAVTLAVQPIYQHKDTAIEDLMELVPASWNILTNGGRSASVSKR